MTSTTSRLFRTSWIVSISGLAACSPRAQITTPYDLMLGGASCVAVRTTGGDIAVVPGPAGMLHVEAERVALTDTAARALQVTVGLDDSGKLARVEWT